jgi:hypothetical protein
MAGHEGMSEPRLDWALESAAEQAGCAVCRVVRDAENGFWHFFFYEAFQEPDAARAAREGIGYCARHLGQVLARQDGFVSASMALPAVEAALAALSSPPTRGLFSSPAPPPRVGEACPLCGEMGRLERDGVRTLAALVRDRKVGPERLEDGELVCYDHATLALEDENLDPGGVLRDALRDVLERRREALRAFLDSFDAERGRPAPDVADPAGGGWRALRDEPGRLA